MSVVSLRREAAVRSESRRLVGMLRDAFPDIVHVVDVELDAATDQGIWEYARRHNLIVTSKDSDFRQLAFLHGPPPKVVWLRVGNGLAPTSPENPPTCDTCGMELVEGVTVDDERLGSFCAEHGIRSLRLFGSALHGTLRP